MSKLDPARQQCLRRYFSGKRTKMYKIRKFMHRPNSGPSSHLSSQNVILFRKLRKPFYEPITEYSKSDLTDHVGGRTSLDVDLRFSTLKRVPTIRGLKYSDRALIQLRPLYQVLGPPGRVPKSNLNVGNLKYELDPYR